ncbi:hypothetical protein HDV57DRAFT_501984 [Trichoderma longibrachiatum]
MSLLPRPFVLPCCLLSIVHLCETLHPDPGLNDGQTKTHAGDALPRPLWRSPAAAGTESWNSKVEVWELSASGFPFGAIAMPACDPRPGPRCPVSTCGRGTAQVDVGASGVFCLHWSCAIANVKPNAAALQIWRLFMNDNCGNNLKSTPMH